MAQRMKNLPAMQEPQEIQVRSLGQEDPLEEEMATHSSTSARKIPWTEEPCRLQSMGSQRVRCPFHYRGLKCKSKKSRNTWSNRQIWPWSTEWSRAKANRILPRKCTGHSKHSFSTTQEKTLQMDITRQSILKSDWLYSLQPKMEKLCTVNKNKTRSWLWLRSWTPY